MIKVDVFSHYEPVPESGCWLWLGAVSTNGYGRIKVGRDRAVKYAHRLFYAHHVGEIPDEMSVLHRCDTRLCVNPSHLFLGTQADNMADMARKGRSLSGVRHPAAKLSEEQIRAIRGSIGETQRSIASRFGICQQSVSRIRAGGRA